MTLIIEDGPYKGVTITSPMAPDRYYMMSQDGQITYVRTKIEKDSAYYIKERKDKK